MNLGVMKASAGRLARIPATALSRAEYATSRQPEGPTGPCADLNIDVKNTASLPRGTGGRSSFNGIVATVFGATGFMGRYVCNRLGKIGTQVVIPYRGDSYEVLRLRLVGDLGQVLFMPYHLQDDVSLRKAMRYSNVVVNLVGRDFETRNFSFDDVHVEGPRRLARLAREAGVARFIHVSALNASPSPREHVLAGGSRWSRSKWAGERAVLEEFPDATVFRPADVWGQEDRFLRYYAGPLRRNLTFIPLWKMGRDTVKQPVCVSDVAAGIVAAIRDPDARGKMFQAVGPKRYVLGDLVEYMYSVMRKDSSDNYRIYDSRFDPTVALKAWLMTTVAPYTPLGNFHMERIEREYQTDEVDADLPTLDDLGVRLTQLEDVIRWELRPFTAAMYHSHAFEEPMPMPPPPVAAP